jgi:predicted dehydrogenase
MRVLLIGAGRMGLTHIALFNLLTEMKIRWTVVEPSTVLRLGIKHLLSKQMLEACEERLPTSIGDFDFAIITSPTIHHAAAYAVAAPLAQKCFVEKPLCIKSPSLNTLCGYVLLHHPLQKMIKEYCQNRTITQVDLTLKANTIVASNKGWRGRLATGGGVLNEFGSHLMSLLVDLAGPVDHIKVDSSKTVYSVDAPDLAELTGQTLNGAAISISMDWSDTSVRKPVYGVALAFSDGSRASHDFYEAYLDGQSQSIADNPTDLGAYLRGIEFTNQARYFLDHDEFGSDISIAVEVDRILSELNDHSR